MQSNVFYVATVENEIGLCAISGAIPSSHNLVGFVSHFITFNVCKTKKEADTIAQEWNKAFKKNGKQK